MENINKYKIALFSAILSNNAPYVQKVGQYLKSVGHLDRCKRAGASPLFLAIMEGKSDCIKVLVNLGVDLNFQNSKYNNCTPLHIAIVPKKDFRTTKLLLRAGADPMVADGGGLSAVSYLKSESVKKIIGEKTAVKFGEIYRRHYEKKHGGVHFDCACTNCEMEPLVGPRYECVGHESLQLCLKCFSGLGERGQYSWKEYPSEGKGCSRVIPKTVVPENVVKRLEKEKKREKDLFTLLREGCHASEVKSVLLKTPGVLYAQEEECKGGSTALHVAAGQCKRADVVTVLLETDRTIVTARDARGRSAMHLAGMFGNCEILQILLSFGGETLTGSVDSDGNIPLWSAIRGKKRKAVKMLLKVTAVGDFTGELKSRKLLREKVRSLGGEKVLKVVDEHFQFLNKQLVKAQMVGESERVAALLRSGAEEKVLLETYVKEGVVRGVKRILRLHPNLLRSVVDQKTGNSLLALACRVGNLEMVKCLFSFGARNSRDVFQVNRKNQSPLSLTVRLYMKFVEEKYRTIAHFLVDALIEKKKMLLKLRENFSSTAKFRRMLRKMSSRSSGSADPFKEVVEYIDDQYSKYGLKKIEGINKRMRLYLEHYGANVNYIDKKNSRSVLHYLVKENELKRVEYLISRNIDVNQIDSHGNPAIFYAVVDVEGQGAKKAGGKSKKKMQNLMCECLLKAGANVYVENGAGRLVVDTIPQNRGDILELVEKFSLHERPPPPPNTVEEEEEEELSSEVVSDDVAKAQKRHNAFKLIANVFTRFIPPAVSGSSKFRSSGETENTSSGGSMKLDWKPGTDDDALELSDKKKIELFGSASTNIIQFKDLKMQKEIGMGGSASVVYRASWNFQDVAVKVFRLLVEKFFESSEDDSLKREMKLMGSLSHPNVIGFFGVCFDRTKFGLVMEFCALGDIRDFFKNCIKKDGKSYPLREKLRLAAEIASGMAYLNTKKVIHRDLKCENVLINESEKAKIMDFGLSRAFSDMQSKTFGIGTSRYMAPEVCLGKKYGFKVDVYSFAIMLYEMLLDDFDPYKAKINSEMRGNIHFRAANDATFRPDLSKYAPEVPDWIVDLTTKAWSHEVSKRPSFAAICGLFSRKLGDDSIVLYIFERDREREEDAVDYEFSRSSSLEELKNLIFKNCHKKVDAVYLGKRLLQKDCHLWWLDNDCSVSFVPK